MPLQPVTAQLSRRTALLLLSGATALLFIACGAGDEGSSTRGAGGLTRGGGAVTAFTIVADDLAWDLDRVEVPIGQEITVTVENREGADHNLHVRSDGEPQDRVGRGADHPDAAVHHRRTGRVRVSLRLHPFMKGVIVAS